MFGMGGSEILVILVVALLFLGPEKLPQAAKTLSKGIRDIKRQSRALQSQIEDDDQIGGAIRDIKSALRGDEAPVRPKPIKPRKLPDTAAAPAIAAVSGEIAEPAAEIAELAPLTMPQTAGEPDLLPEPADGAEAHEEDGDPRSLIRPAEGTVAKGSEPKHG